HLLRCQFALARGPALGLGSAGFFRIFCGIFPQEASRLNNLAIAIFGTAEASAKYCSHLEQYFSSVAQPYDSAFIHPKPLAAGSHWKSRLVRADLNVSHDDASARALRL